MARTLAIPRPPAAVTAAVGRYWPLALLLISALCLIVAEFLTLREIRTITAVPRGGTVTGGANHHYALAVIGVALLPMGFGAVMRSARPAAVACILLALAAALVVFSVDYPHINDPGIFAETYDLAQARPAAGFYVESFGAALALVGGIAALVLVPRPDRPARAARRPRGEGQERH